MVGLQNQKYDPQNKNTDYDKVILLLMEDIKDLQNRVKSQKEENTKLSETIAKKMEVIFKMEQTSQDILKSGISSQALTSPLERAETAAIPELRACGTLNNNPYQQTRNPPPPPKFKIQNAKQA